MKHTGCVHMDPATPTQAHRASGKAQEPQDYHDLIDRLADQVEQKVIEIRHDFHQHPELPNREFRTAKKIAEHLRSIGLDEVKTEVGVTGVVGLLEGGQPGDHCVALRADFDALPVKELADVPFKSTVVDEDYPGGPFPVAHACGHETHAAMLMGAAEVLAQMRDRIPGRVKFLFQPAEEGPPVGEDGGAAMMVKEGALKDPKPDVAFAIHSSPFPVNTMERIFGHENMCSGPPMMAYDDHSVFQLACGGVYLLLGCQDTKWTDKGLEPIDPSKPIPFNHNPHFYVKDEVLKTGIRMHANVVMDFLTGKI